MENTSESIYQLKENIKQILSMYEDQRQSARELKGQNEHLLSEIKQKNEFIDELKKKIEVLKTAKTISVSEDDKEEVKKKINKIVREIDKSIGLLNE